LQQPLNGSAPATGTPGVGDDDLPSGRGTQLLALLVVAGTATFLLGGVIALIVVLARWRGSARRRADRADDV